MTDLFGNPVEKEIDAAVEKLKSYDSGSFEERLSRFRLVNKIFPFGRKDYGSGESYRIFNEAIHSFIFGQYIATLILSQSFIERRFQEYFNARLDDKRADYTLSKFIKGLKGTGFLPDYLLERIDRIRVKRNPMVHFKKPLEKNTMMSRVFEEEIGPDQLLYNDAKEALEVMLHMVCRPVL